MPIAAVSAVGALAAYHGGYLSSSGSGSSSARHARKLNTALKEPMMMEGPKTIAGEKGAVSERSFVMAR